MSIDDDKTFVLNDFLGVIAGISDKSYQERIWIRGEGPECDDFTETVCFFFELGDFILNNYRAYGITDQQYYHLIKFRADFEKFSNRQSWAPEFIDTPEWAEIMEKAKEVLKAFNFQKRPFPQGPENF